MKRRDFLRSGAGIALAATGGLSAPRIARAAEQRVPRFVPQAHLADLDPIWTSISPTRAVAAPFPAVWGVEKGA